MTIKLARRVVLIAFSLLVASPGRAQTATQNQTTPDPVETVSLEPAMLEIAPITGTLKESVQKGQQLVWFGKEDPKDRRFQAANMYVRRVPAQRGYGRSEDDIRCQYFGVRLPSG